MNQLDNAKKKRHRSMNFTRQEQRLLQNLVKRYEHILNNKDTTNNVSQKKKLAWDEIQKFFNASPSCSTYRTMESLRKKVYGNNYENKKAMGQLSEPSASTEADREKIQVSSDSGEPDAYTSSDFEEGNFSIENYTIMFKKSPSPQPEHMITDPQGTPIATLNQSSSVSTDMNLIPKYSECIVSSNGILVGAPLHISRPTSNFKSKTLHSSTSTVSNLSNDLMQVAVPSPCTLAEELSKLEAAKLSLESLRNDARHKAEIHELQVKQMMIEEQIKTQQLENLRADAELKQVQLENFKLACEIKVKQLEDPDEQ